MEVVGLDGGLAALHHHHWPRLYVQLPGGGGGMLVLYSSVVSLNVLLFELSEK